MRFLQRAKAADVRSLLKPLLAQRIQEQIGKAGDALALSMRVLVCDFVGVRDDVDLRSLLPLQCEDGGWEIGWIYGYGSSGVKIGNRGLTTALAIKAIQCLHVPSSPTLTLVEPEAVSKMKGLRLKGSLQRLFHVTKLGRKAVET